MQTHANRALAQLSNLQVTVLRDNRKSHTTPLCSCVRHSADQMQAHAHPPWRHQPRAALRYMHPPLQGAVPPAWQPQ